MAERPTGHTIGNIPNTDALVRRCRGQKQTIGAEGDGGNFGSMVVEQFYRGRDFPEPDLAVNASGGKLSSLGLIGDPANRTSVSADLGGDRAVGECEKVERSALSGGDAGAIVRRRS